MISYEHKGGAWLLPLTGTRDVPTCQDCEETNGLEFVSWIDAYLCPECLANELG